MTTKASPNRNADAAFVTIFRIKNGFQRSEQNIYNNLDLSDKLEK
jgi:hypothetical protein